MPAAMESEEEYIEDESEGDKTIPVYDLEDYEKKRAEGLLGGGGQTSEQESMSSEARDFSEGETVGGLSPASGGSGALLSGDGTAELRPDELQAMRTGPDGFSAEDETATADVNAIRNGRVPPGSSLRSKWASTPAIVCSPRTP